MAIETPHKGRFRAQQVLRCHVVTPREEMPAAIQTALHEVMAALTAQNVQPTGPWFAFHHRLPSETFDFDVCFPVAQRLETSGRLENAALPEFEVVRTAYHGPYEGLPSAWREFHRWVEDHGHKIDERAIEQYSLGPSDNPHPQSWQTDLMFVLAEGELTKERVA